MLPFRSVLVTGAAGFVGGYLVEALRARLPADARIFTPTRESLDLRDVAETENAVAEVAPDLVFHLAAQSSVGQSLGAAADTWSANLIGTLNLARAIALAAPDATVAFTSSSEIYGAAFNDGPVDEQSVPLPQSAYARSKRAAEEALADVLAPSNRLCILRPSNHSGPGQDTRFVLPAFADQIAAIEAGQQSPVIKVGSLTAERDFLDVRDVVAAYCDVLAAAGDARRETWTISSNQTVPIRRLLDRLLALTDVVVRIEEDPFRMRPSDVPRAVIDSTRIRCRTGWRPTRTLDTTIADVLAECRSRRAFGTA